MDRKTSKQVLGKEDREKVVGAKKRYLIEKGAVEVEWDAIVKKWKCNRWVGIVKYGLSPWT